MKKYICELCGLELKTSDSGIVNPKTGEITAPLVAFQCTNPECNASKHIKMLPAFDVK